MTGAHSSDSRREILICLLPSIATLLLGLEDPSFALFRFFSFSDRSPIFCALEGCNCRAQCRGWRSQNVGTNFFFRRPSLLTLQMRAGVKSSVSKTTRRMLSLRARYQSILTTESSHNSYREAHLALALAFVDSNTLGDGQLLVS